MKLFLKQKQLNIFRIEILAGNAAQFALDFFKKIFQGTTYPPGYFEILEAGIVCQPAQKMIFHLLGDAARFICAGFGIAGQQIFEKCTKSF